MEKGCVDRKRPIKGAKKEPTHWLSQPKQGSQWSTKKGKLGEGLMVVG